MTEEEIEALAERVADKVVARMEPVLRQMAENVDEIMEFIESLDEDIDGAWNAPKPEVKETLRD